MTKAEFSNLAGVSRAAITLAVKRGNLIAADDGSIDPNEPANVLYLQSQAMKRGDSFNPGTIAEKTAPPKDPAPKLIITTIEKPTVKHSPKIELPPLSIPGLEDPELPELEMIDFDNPEKYLAKYPDPVVRDKVAATIKRLVEIRRHSQALRREEGELIERDYVAGRFAHFGEALRQQLLTMPRRTAAQLTARAKSGGEREVEEYMAEEISAAIGRALGELTLE